MILEPNGKLQQERTRGARGAVLILESDRPIRALIAEWLELAGYESVGVHDVATASRVTARYDIILVDIPAPLRAAQDMVAKLAKAEPSTPIIAMSADVLAGGMLSAAAVAHELGVTEVLGKPFDRQTLLDAMSRARKIRGRPVAKG